MTTTRKRRRIAGTPYYAEPAGPFGAARRITREDGSLLGYAVPSMWRNTQQGWTAQHHVLGGRPLSGTYTVTLARCAELLAADPLQPPKDA